MTCRVTWLGHSTVLIELGGARILTDPVLRDRVAAPAARRARRSTAAHLESWTRCSSRTSTTTTSTCPRCG